MQYLGAAIESIKKPLSLIDRGEEILRRKFT